MSRQHGAGQILHQYDEPPALAVGGSARRRGLVTFPELFQLPTVVDLATAGKAVGIGIGTAYKLVQQGSFPCRVIRLGHRYKVPTTGLMKALGIDITPVDRQDVADGAAFAARVR